MQYLLQLYVVMLLVVGAPLDALVDREHGLPSWYDPGPNEEAAQALDRLQQAAEADGCRIVVLSGYRTYDYQAEVQARELKRGDVLGSSYAASPGHSEHQLGTAMDVAWPGVPLGASDPRNERLYAWLADNAHRFGFVISYPYKTGEAWPYSNRWMPLVTEYIHEPWHIRYVGESLARKIFEEGYLEPTSPLLPQDFFRPWP